MTRKHFAQFAAAIKEMIDSKQHDAAARMTETCLGIFAAENGRFDRDRFLSACGWDADAWKTGWGSLSVPVSELPNWR